MEGRPVAVIECPEEIPCNPCETACPQGAIQIGNPITRRPRLDAARCTGCGLCVAACPGLAIFLVKEEADTAEVTFPYEFLPLPQVGDVVTAVGREGQPLGAARVVAVRQVRTSDGTWLVTLAVPRALSSEVRGMRRL
ncbi:MAG: hypothetical protein PWQ41_574 [Bacillota bacterium]|nr:hypothetical protein [Bacillota bacterium]MDK2881920.1 hypothetical protein [Bacillota bacterium]MDK2924800.1 hypothetical protein [Bacillota bacterium]